MIREVIKAERDLYCQAVRTHLVGAMEILGQKRGGTGGTLFVKDGFAPKPRALSLCNPDVGPAVPDSNLVSLRGANAILLHRQPILLHPFPQSPVRKFTSLLTTVIQINLGIFTRELEDI
jgi:hypothetical protein